MKQARTQAFTFIDCLKEAGLWFIGQTTLVYRVQKGQFVYFWTFSQFCPKTIQKKLRTFIRQNYALR